MVTTDLVTYLGFQTLQSVMDIERELLATANIVLRSCLSSTTSII